MSRYHLTEAYGELYNPRLTEESFYDNLRFVDYLQQEQIEEVMESLIWEFMDYGDTLDEAVETLDVIFADDEIISESLEMITEAMSVSQRRASQRGLRGNYSAQDAQRFQTSSKAASSRATRDLENASRLAKGALSSASDSAARARRAERSTAVRGALRSAAGTVGSALSKARTGIRNRISQLKQVGSAAAEKAKAGLAQVARVGRGIAGGVEGAVVGARIGARRAYNAPAPVAKTRTPGRTQTQQARDVARNANGDVFATPARPVLTQKPPLPPRPRVAVAPVTSAPKPRGMGSAKNRARMEKNKEAYEKAKQQLKASVDYDLLTQYMVEDIIYEGYADTEAEALYILENMSEENLINLAECYLED
jgi:hypothetical protein